MSVWDKIKGEGYTLWGRTATSMPKIESYQDVDAWTFYHHGKGIFSDDWSSEDIDLLMTPVTEEEAAFYGVDIDSDATNIVGGRRWNWKLRQKAGMPLTKFELWASSEVQEANDSWGGDKAGGTLGEHRPEAGYRNSFATAIGGGADAGYGTYVHYVGSHVIARKVLESILGEEGGIFAKAQLSDSEIRFLDMLSFNMKTLTGEDNRESPFSIYQPSEWEFKNPFTYWKDVITKGWTKAATNLEQQKLYLPENLDAWIVFQRLMKTDAKNDAFNPDKAPFTFWEKIYLEGFDFKGEGGELGLMSSAEERLTYGLFEERVMEFLQGKQSTSLQGLKSKTKTQWSATDKQQANHAPWNGREDPTWKAFEKEGWTQDDHWKSGVSGHDPDWAYGNNNKGWAFAEASMLHQDYFKSTEAGSNWAMLQSALRLVWNGGDDGAGDLIYPIKDKLDDDFSNLKLKPFGDFGRLFIDGGSERQKTYFKRMLPDVVLGELQVTGLTGNLAEDLGSAAYAQYLAAGGGAGTTNPLELDFLEFAGGFNGADHIWLGPEEGRLKKEFFLELEGIRPPEGGEGAVVETRINVPEKIQTALTEADTGNRDFKTARFTKKPNPFPASGSHADIPWETYMRKWYLAFYLNHYYSRKLAYEEGKPAKELVDSYDLFNSVAFWCATAVNQLWTQMVHDNAVADAYAFYVAIHKISPTLSLPEGLDNFLDDLEDAVADSMDEVSAPLVEDEAVSGITPEEREKIYKQCALLLNMHKPGLKQLNHPLHQESRASPFHKITDATGFTSYNNRIHVVESGIDPSVEQTNNLMNKLISPKAAFVRPFVDIKTDEAAHLVPQVRLYKVWHDPFSGLREMEFKIPPMVSHQRVKDLNTTAFDRGDGMGLKEFSWSYDGETPATASKYITAKMTLVFQTFNDFVRERANIGTGEFYRWVDLFVSPTNMNRRPDADHQPHNLHYDPEYYRIKVDVGYATEGLNEVKEGLAEAVQMINVTFMLVLKDNDIVIEEDQTVTITANYGAYIEEAMDSTKFNALNSPAIQKRREEFREQWEAAWEAYNTGTGCDAVELDMLRNRINKELPTLVTKQHKTMMNLLLKHDRLFYINFNEKDINAFRKGGVFQDIPSFAKNGVVEAADVQNAAERLAELAKNEKSERTSFVPESDPAKVLRAYYFYFGDLIYLATSNLYKSETDDPWTDYKATYLSGAENTKILLLDFEYYNSLAKAQKKKTINIADIPISVDFFFKWFTNNVIKNKVTSMGIGEFIRRLLVELISEALSEVCITQKEGHAVTFRMGSFLAGGLEAGSVGPPLDPILAMLKNNDKDSPGTGVRLNVAKNYDALPIPAAGFGMALPLMNRPPGGSREIKDQYNYVYVYGDFSDPDHPGQGIRKDDEKTGTHHLHVGRDRGLIKKVSFSKNNIKYHRESRMFNQGQAGLLQLSAVYNSKVTMIGNTIFLPGQEFWLNPYGFGGPAFGMPEDPPLSWQLTTEQRKQRDLLEEQVAMGIKSQQRGEPTHAAPQQQGRDAAEALKKLHEPENDAVVNSYANVMGIGGYQMVLKINCSITPGLYETTMDAKFVYSGYPLKTESEKYADFKAKNASDPSADPGDKSVCKAIRQATLASDMGE